MLTDLSKKQILPPLLKIRDVSKILSLSRCTVRNLLEKGDLAGHRITASPRAQRVHLRITRASLLQFYQKRFGHPLRHVLLNPFEN